MDAQAPQQPSIDPLEALPVAGRDLASLLPWPARGDGGGAVGYFGSRQGMVVDPSFPLIAKC